MPEKTHNILLAIIRNIELQKAKAPSRIHNWYLIFVAKKHFYVRCTNEIISKVEKGKD